MKLRTKRHTTLLQRVELEMPDLSQLEQRETTKPEKVLGVRNVEYKTPEELDAMFPASGGFKVQPGAQARYMGARHSGKSLYANKLVGQLMASMGDGSEKP